jgi:hypothetical protein
MLMATHKGITVTSAPLQQAAPNPTLPLPPLVSELIDPYPEIDPEIPSTAATPVELPPAFVSAAPTSPSWPYWVIGGTGLAAVVAILATRGTSTQIAGLHGRKIRGMFCEVELAPKRDFDASSFRWKKTGMSWLLTGCPKGEWNAREQWCRVGTQGYRLLSAVGKGDRCSRKAKRVRKG